MREPLWVVQVVGGDASLADDALWLDLEDVHPGHWQMLLLESDIPKVLQQTGAREVRRQMWTGDAFGDGHAGCITRAAPGVLRLSDRTLEGVLPLPNGWAWEDK